MIVIAILLILFAGGTTSRHRHHSVHGFTSYSNLPAPSSSRRSSPLATNYHHPYCSSFSQRYDRQPFFSCTDARRNGSSRSRILASSASESSSAASTTSSATTTPITITTTSTNIDAHNYNNKPLTKHQIIDKSMEYLASCIHRHLDSTKKQPLTAAAVLSGVQVNANYVAPSDENRHHHDVNADGEKGSIDNQSTAPAMIPYNLAIGRFVDLATSLRGEQILENLFLPPTNTVINGNNNLDDGSTTTQSSVPDARIVQYAIVALQSLLIYGMQIGVVGSDESQAKLVRHLFRPGDDISTTGSASASNERGGVDDVVMEKYPPLWDAECIRLLKYRRNVSPGKLVLKELKWKRTARGAFDLLVDMGVWTKHEDVALLRSGFPVRFTERELQVAMEAAADESKNNGDPDAVLGLRKDLRHFKVYTIDGPTTLDIDDGISVEVLSDGGDGDDRRLRYWIHIADVDRWAPRGSELLRVAERRGTSLYLPTTTLCMFPEIMSSGIMSLESWQDKCALSLGVELNADGTIIPSSIIVTPSNIHVHYRLTYEQADEMLDEGVGYTEEWQIGALLAAATLRRAHRVSRGSTEGMVPFPIPKGMVTATYDEKTNDYDISLKIEATHNSGSNVTTMTGTTNPGGAAIGENAHHDLYVSSSQLIVTEMMILAGEAIGKWQIMQMEQEESRTDDTSIQFPNRLDLPFRRQTAPDLKSREIEARHLDFLLEMNQLYPHAWYARRFFNKVVVSEETGPHYGMGLDCYVQWTSPIRRLTDLQVHSALKRYLRRKRVNELLQAGLPIPSEISSMDLGYDISSIEQSPASLNTIDPIDFTSGLGMIFAGRPVQSSSSNYWLFEYIRRLIDRSHEEVMFESIVLGCVNKDRFQYAIFVYELGMEHRYLSETGKLDEGQKLWLKVTSVNPRMELLTFSLASRSGGIHTQPSAAAAA